MQLRLILAVVILSTNASAQDANATRGFFATNGTKLYYEIAGNGPSVVLIHGGWLNSAQ